jgi:hypothetical protein
MIGMANILIDHCSYNCDHDTPSWDLTDGCAECFVIRPWPMDSGFNAVV